MTATIYRFLERLTHRRSPLTGGDYTSPYLVPEVAVASPEANIVTSELVGKPGRHAVLIDLDVPAYLVPSSTPGHSHLYIDKEVSIGDLTGILHALARAGVVEPGYADASAARGYSALRLPWIKKETPRPKSFPFLDDAF